jgi:uncharacterized protein YlxW (UPF0749 family)
MTARPTSEQHPGVPVRHYDDLLTQVLSSALDQDYQAAARRSGGRGAGFRATGTFVVVVVSFGTLLGVSALQTVRDRPAQVAQRAQLVDEIHRRQDRLDGMHATLSSLQDDVTKAQADLADTLRAEAKISDRLTALGMDAGTAPVSGPGVTVTVDNAPNSGEDPAGLIRDSDLQVLVNGLWQAGAEAIAINGHRLTSLSSIRYAGRAITVNYQSLTPPYVIEATGDPDTLPAALMTTAAGATWESLHSNLGIRFDVLTEAKLVLPGDPHDRLRYARERGSRR